MEAETIGKANVPFAEAINYARKRNIVLPDVYYGKLIAQQRSQAVSVAGLSSIEQIKFVVDQLDKVLKQGKTFKDFQDAVKANTLGIDLPKHRLDNIFRTNIQSAYNRGRWEQQAKVAATRPFLMYDAINDGRTRPAHHAMDNVILPRDHDWWKSHYPPNGYRCRCTVISLTEAQAKKRGGVSDIPKDGVPDKGWDYNVGLDYAGPVTKAVERSTNEVVNRFPAATLAAQKAKKAIAKKAEPITLDRVMKLGREAIDELDENDYNTPVFHRRMEDMLLAKVMGVKAKELRLDPRGSVKRGAVVDHAKKHLGDEAFHVMDKAPLYTEDGFKDKVYSRLPLPAKWLKAVKAHYGTVNLKYTSGRASANQGKFSPTLHIDPDRGDIVTHEFMHLVQVAFPEIQAMAEEMHAKRTAGANQKRLADLFPNTGYGASEVAKEDKYFAAYMGREYLETVYTQPGRASAQWKPWELLTMASEALLGDVTAFGNAGGVKRRNMFNKDRETVEFILGLFLAYA